MNTDHLISMLVEENEKEIKEYEEGFLLAPISDDSVRKLQEKAKADFSIELPDDYIKILKLSNGFCVNGLNIFGSEPYDEDYYINGLIESNTEYWTEPTLRNYFSFGDESSMRLVFNIGLSQFEAVDNVTWERLNSFDSFTKLLTYVIEEAEIFE